MKTSKRHQTKTYFEPSTVLLLKQIGIGVLVLLTVASILAVVGWATRLSFVTLKDIKIDGGYTISHDYVRDVVEEKLAGTYLGLIPRRFAYFYPEAAVIEAVNNVSRIKNVQIHRDGGTNLRITFDEYVPEALWCNREGDGDCLFLDMNGYAFASAPDLKGGSMVRYYATESAPVEHLSPFSVEDFAATKKFIALAEEIGWYIDEVEINQTRDVFYLLAEGGELKATLIDNPEKPFDNLRTILNSEEFSHLKPGNFQYLDLRFGTRVFVNEELPDLFASSTATTTASSTEVIE